MEILIRIQSIPTFRQYLRFCRRGVSRRIWAIQPFAILSLIGFFLAPIIPSEEHTGALTQYKEWSGLLLLPVIVFVLLPLSTYFSAKKRWQTAAELREPRTFEFTDRGVSTKGLTFSGEIAWASIGRAETAGTLILLYTHQQTGFLIPRDAITPEQEASLRMLLRNKVANCQRL
jgi:hypothetical protein